MDGRISGPYLTIHRDPLELQIQEPEWTFGPRMPAAVSELVMLTARGFCHA